MVPANTPSSHLAMETMSPRQRSLKIINPRDEMCLMDHDSIESAVLDVEHPGPIGFPKQFRGRFPFTLSLDNIFLHHLAHNFLDSGPCRRYSTIWPMGRWFDRN